MTHERPKSPRARLFVALGLPAGVRGALGDWQRQASALDPALRAVAEASLHLTLVFLGWMAEKQIPAITASALDFPAGAPRMRLAADVVGLPERGRFRLLAVPVLGGEVEALQARVEANLVSEGLYRPEKRPFWPHLTLARVRPESRGSRRPSVLGAEPPALPAAAQEPFFGVRVTLYRSNLRPEGAEYIPLAEKALDPGAHSEE